jgi:site-specific DNA recombinase
MKKRAVTYARVSGDDRGKEGRNLIGQLEICREYALSRGYYIVAELPEDDRGASGASFELPQLNQALEMARNGKFDILVAREIDRFARGLAKQLIIE